jgi:hypothetical protein
MRIVRAILKRPRSGGDAPMCGSGAQRSGVRSSAFMPCPALHHQDPLVGNLESAFITHQKEKPSLRAHKELYDFIRPLPARPADYQVV